MAKLPDPVSTNIFTLQRNLMECLDATTAMEFRLFREVGETVETLPEFEELQQIEERLVTLYSRLHNTLLRVTTSQPVAPKDLLELLYRSIDWSLD